MDQAAANMPMTLPTIEEEESGASAVEEAPQAWMTSNDPIVVSKSRAYAKASHTKHLRKIEAALDNPLVSAEQLKVMRKEACRLFAEVERRHNRLAEVVAPGFDPTPLDQWIAVVDDNQRRILQSLADAKVDTATTGTRTHQSTTSTRSSVKSKLRDAELEESEMLLRLEQLKEDQKQREQEEAAVRAIESGRQLREMQFALQQKQLRRAVLQDQAASIVQEDDDEPFHGFEAVTSVPDQLVAAAAQSEQPQVSVAPTTTPAPTDQPVLAGQGHVQPPPPPPTGSSTPLTTTTPFRRLQGFASRVSSLFTPRANKTVQRYSPSSLYSSSSTATLASHTPSEPVAFGARLGVTQTTTSGTGPKVSALRPTNLDYRSGYNPDAYGSAVFGAPPAASTSAMHGPAVFGAPPVLQPTQTHGPVVYGAPPGTSISQTHGPAVFGAPPGVSSATCRGPAVYGAPPVAANGTFHAPTAFDASFVPPTGTYQSTATSNALPVTSATNPNGSSMSTGPSSSAVGAQQGPPVPGAHPLAPLGMTHGPAAQGPAVYGAPAGGQAQAGPNLVIATCHGPAGHQPPTYPAAGYGAAGYCPPSTFRFYGPAGAASPLGPGGYPTYGGAPSFPPPTAAGPQPDAAAASRLYGNPNATATSMPTSPEDWIYDLQGFRRSARLGYRSAVRLPKAELPKFDGTPLNWPMFIQTFGAQVDRVCSDDSERITLLQSCLSDELQKELSHLLINPINYQQCLVELHRKFGNARMVAAACSQKLLQLKAFSDGDFTAARKFAGDLRAAVSTLRHGGYSNELQSNATLASIVGKLPPNLRSRWAQASYQITDHMPDLMDLDKWLDNYILAEACVRVGIENSAPPSSHSSKDRQEQKGGRNSKPKVFTGATTDGASASDTSSSAKCAHCDRPHMTRECRKFQALEMDKRIVIVREKNLCISCLEPGHGIKSCSRKKKCGLSGCKGAHSQWLHGAPKLYPAKDAEKGTETSAPKSLASSSEPTEPDPKCRASVLTPARMVMLPIVEVVVSSNGHARRVLALLDWGSEVTMLCESVAKELKLAGPVEEARIGSWHAHDPAFRTTRIGFQVGAVDGSSSWDITGAYTVPSLNLNRRAVNAEEIRKRWPHLSIVDLSSTESMAVQLLIGSDHSDLLDVLEYRKDPLKKNAPQAVLTHFGWTIMGDVRQAMRDDVPLACNRISLATTETDNLAQALDRFLLADEYGTHPDVKPPVSQEVKRCRDILQETTRFLPEEGGYEAGLLFKSDEVDLPNNYQGALERFKRTMRKVERNPVFFDVVTNDMQHVVDAGYARKLSNSEVKALPPGRTWFLPWHLVQHPHKPGKWRIVFDASARFHGVALNDILLKGEVLMVDMSGVLIRFRQHPVAVCADLTKMFYQARVPKHQQSFYLFLYRKPGSTDPPDVYVMTRHIFGSICSPSICAHIMRQAAKDADPDDVDFAQREMDRSWYVDNWVTSFESEELANEGADRMTRTMKKAGFELGQWGSNRQAVLASRGGPAMSSLHLNLDSLPTERTLGIELDFETDEFVLKATGSPDCMTKRECLRAIASNFDVIGFIQPALLPGKLILQKVIKLPIGWDDPIPLPLQNEWREWATSFSSLNNLRIPRCYCKERYYKDKTELIVFCDASEKAFGAIAYLRFHLVGGGYKVVLVYAKLRVAPLKYVSMPRLELCGCLLAARLVAMILKELDIFIAVISLFTDSITCLRWFYSKDCVFAVYVGNRVGEVLSLTEAPWWHYVPTALNPADDISRGIAAADLTITSRYFIGEEFLYKPREEWPTFPDGQPPLQPDPEDPEIRPMKWVGAAQPEVSRVDELLASRLPLPFSRIKRAVAFARRWMVEVRVRKNQLGTGSIAPAVGRQPPIESHTLRPPEFVVRQGLSAGKEIKIKELSPKEIQDALDMLIRRAQATAYAAELRALSKGLPIDPSSSLAKVGPFLDDNGLLCVGGRIERAPAPFDVRHPIVLPPGSPLTERIVKEIHLKCGHAAAWRTLTEVQRKYWIPAPRRLIARVVDRCTLCRRKAATVAPPIMAALPASRLKPYHPPFTCSGVDYFGPIEVVLFRRRVKRWVCLFTCMTTRAVHLEMAYGLDTDSFLVALGNFKAARGTPLIIHSDNGTNFKGAKRELAEGLANLDQSKIYAHLATIGIEWRFNPPAAPHFGGSWERLVQAAKRALEGVMHLRHFTDQTLSGSLKQVEHLLNSRPLTYVSVDPAAPEPLTPFHLLLGRANPNIPPDAFSPDDLSHRKRWRIIQAFADHYWRRWMSEYLPSLIERRKWLSKSRNLRVGDIVLIVDENTPRGQWPLGLVERVYEGPDKVVRSADVRFKDTVLHRPVIKLCLLEAETEEDETMDASAAPPDAVDSAPANASDEPVEPTALPDDAGAIATQEVDDGGAKGAPAVQPDAGPAM